MSIRLFNPSGGFIDLNAGGDGTAANVFTLPAETGTLLTTASTGGVSQAMLASGVAGTGPAFSAYASATTSTSNGVFTKVLFATEDFDTNGNFASSRFTPTVEGYYQISCSITWASASTFIVSLYKNGASISNAPTVGISGVLDSSNVISKLVYLNGTTDYVEVYGYQNSGGGVNIQAQLAGTWFTGALVRAA
jgi:hypothetical protein